MLKIIEINTQNQQEASRYEAFAQSITYSDIMQSIEWGKLKSKTGWKPRYYLFEDNSGNVVASTMLLAYRLPVVKKYFWYAPRGPLVRDITNPDIVREVLQTLKSAAKKEGIIFIKLDPALELDTGKVFDTEVRKLGAVSMTKAGSGFEGTQPRCNFKLDINKSEEELMASFHEKTRYNIRLSARKGVTVQIETDREKLKEFYAVHQETAKRDGFLIRDISYYYDIWDMMYPSGKMKLFGAYYEGKMISATIAFYFADQCWYTYGASSNEHRNVMPNYAIQWAMIQEAVRQKCKIYDFRGVPCDYNPDDKLSGLIRFKQGFNPVHTKYIGEYDMVLNTPLYWAFNIAKSIRDKRIKGDSHD